MTASSPSAPGDWTVRRVLEWTSGYLKAHSETPRLDAEILLAHAWGCPRIQLYTRYDLPLPMPVRETMRELVKRRATAEPVAYLVGHREFFSLEFEIRPGVFIPRPATEALVLEGLEQIRRIENPRVVDLCTGSGCVAVSLAKNAPVAQVTAVDLNPVAVDLARANAERHGVDSRLRVVEGDLFGPLEGEVFDVIVSNPPYVREDEMAELPPDVRDHEPRLALAAGNDGLDVIRRILDESPRYLADKGALLIELSPEQAPAAAALFRQTGRFDTVRIVKDLDRNDRLVVGH